MGTEITSTWTGQHTDGCTADANQTEIKPLKCDKTNPLLSSDNIFDKVILFWYNVME